LKTLTASADWINASNPPVIYKIIDPWHGNDGNALLISTGVDPVKKLRILTDKPHG